jgi:hypothetical protein
MTDTHKGACKRGTANILPPDALEVFDFLMDRHMSENFGEEWRTMCHQSAKIAALALARLYPKTDIALSRVELIALMEGAPGFVHIGWADDPAAIPGKMPAHFAVKVGTGLYDPTFWQLRFVKTPLNLPSEPYFYVPEFLAKAPLDNDGFRWVGLERPTGMLRIAYKMQSILLPFDTSQGLMSEETAEAHAAAVVLRAHMSKDFQL